LVQRVAVVGFYQTGDATRHAAIVQDEGISPVAIAAKDQRKPMLSVRILIDNEDRLLLPGVDGYAHIQTQKLRLDEKIAHEFNELFNLGKYCPWLS
jgi:hypothetical protein